jgi:FAD binding domain in molybdopterin dehydrogenase/Molybdopterin-binding domain of aldehyde dehydrogenase
MKLSTFEYACPNTLSEAIALLASHDGDAKALAGGQSLIPTMAYRVAQPSLLVDLRKITDLRGSIFPIMYPAGGVILLDYITVEDVGHIINPETLHGQTIGAIVQGLGGTLLEHLQ